MGSGLSFPCLPSGAFPVVPSPHPGPPRHLPVIGVVVTWLLAPAPPCEQVLAAVGGRCWGRRVLPPSLSLQPQTTLQAVAHRRGCLGAVPFPRHHAPPPSRRLHPSHFSCRSRTRTPYSPHEQLLTAVVGGAGCCWCCGSVSVRVVVPPPFEVAWRRRRLAPTPRPCSVDSPPPRLVFFPSPLLKSSFHP